MNYPVVQNHVTLKQAVDARELHETLEVKGDFSTWVKKQIERLELVEHADYELLLLKREQVSGVKHRKDYILSVEASKMIAGRSDTKIGNRTLRYFIECEKVALTQRVALPQSYATALRELADVTEQREALALSVAAKDKLILASNEASIKAGEILVRQFAKSIDFIEVGQNKMFEWLKGRGFLMSSNEPYQEYVNRGWFSWKPTKEKCNGEFRYTVRVTPRGKVKLTSLYMDDVENMVATA